MSWRRRFGGDWGRLGLRCEWNQAPLSTLCSKIGSGATPRGGKESYKESGIAFIRSQNVLDFSFSSEGLAFIDETQAAQLDNVIVKSADVLINITGDSVARVCMAPDQYLPARVNQHVAIIRANTERADARFILYFLQYSKDRLLTLASSGATRNALTKRILEELSVNTPTLPQQMAIADMLSALDAKITNNNAINHHLEQMAQALFKSWFVDFEPWGGEQPSDWEEGTVSNVVRLQRGHDLPVNSVTEGKYPVVGSKGIIACHNAFTSSAPVIVMGRSGNIGTPRYYNVDCWAHNTAIYSKEIFGAPLWVYYTLAQIDYSIYKGGSAVPTLNRNHVESFDILIPPISVQQSFHDTIEPLFRQRDALDNESARLAALRDTLMPRLMSGELSVANLGDA